MLRMMLGLAIALSAPLGGPASAQDEDTRKAAQAIMASLRHPPDLYDENLLKASSLEINALRPREAEALARSIADCSGEPEPFEPGTTQCESSRYYFIVVGPTEGALGRLFAIVHYYSISGLSRGPGIRPQQEWANVKRMQHIRDVWKVAVRLRLQQLDREPR